MTDPTIKITEHVTAEQLFITFNDARLTDLFQGWWHDGGGEQEFYEFLDAQGYSTSDDEDELWTD